MDNRFINLLKPSVTKQNNELRKNKFNSNRKAMKQINIPNKDFFENETNQNHRTFHSNPTDWGLQAPYHYDPPEKTSTNSLLPQETEIQKFSPKNSDFIVPSDEDLKELPDLKTDDNWPDLIQNSDYSDSIIEE